MLTHVQTLAGEIGPRGTGTPGEEAAADYVAERLSALGLPLERQTFQAVVSQNAFPLAISVVALLAVALYPLGGVLGRWVAAALACTTAPLLWHTIRTSNNPLRPFLPKVTSRNVLTRIEPQGDLQQRAVILAHLDTNRCRLAWQSKVSRSLEPLTYLTLAMLSSLGALYLIGALLGGSQSIVFGSGWVYLVSLIPAGYVVGMVITLLRDDRVPFSCGAHDNAASVAVALEIGARLAAQPLERTQVWLVFTGAEETDHAGLYTLLRCYGPALRSAAFIGLEGLGSGELVYLTRQGLCAHYRPDAGLHAMAARVAASLPELRARAAWMTMEDEVGTLRRAGYRAICIAGLDPKTGTLPHWHRPDDTVDTISVHFLERAASFLMALLEELDGNRPAPTS
jgi:acetylornithine deacetylase/succinyl-diaminopimelate desuccinylase-like protein